MKVLDPGLRFMVLLPCLLCCSVIALAEVSAQSPNAEGKAEERLKAIYDRGEFRAKNYRPVWLSDSSGFLTFEPDPNSKNPTPWFHDVQSGERRAWGSDGKLPDSEARGLSPSRTHRLVARGAQLLSIDLENRKETLLASSPADRAVEYRNPVWSRDGSRVAFIEADMTDVRLPHPTRTFGNTALPEWAESLKS